MEENARFLWSGYFSLKNKEDIMITWNNLDTLDSYKELSKASRVNLAEVMSGENGAERVKNYSIPMAEGFSYNYAAKAVDDDVLDALVKLAKEAQLAEKFKALYNGEVVNTGEKRLVLHHMTRGQLGDAVNADGVDKRAFYVEQQNRIADFANKVHAGEITNAAGEKFTTVVQIGIGGSDLGPRAMYLALENWAKKNGCGPRSLPPIPICTTVVNFSPAAFVISPACTLFANSAMRFCCST
jgi:glucose-6-phosphate isomerase